jgi:mannosyltransferase OCH1-like enzyme
MAYTIRISQLLRRSKWILLAVLRIQFPLRDIYSITEPFNESKIGPNSDFPKIVFLSWKTKWITRGHFKEIKEQILKNPSWKFYFFDDKSELMWMRDNYEKKPILKIYEEAKFGAIRSDIFRYCLILRYGGIFISINMLFKGDLEDLHNNKKAFLISTTALPYNSSYARNKALEKYQGKSFIQSCIVSSKDHEILINAIKLIEDRYFVCKQQSYGLVDKAVWWFTGPYLLTDAILMYMSDHINELTEVIEISADLKHLLIRSRLANFRYIFAPSYIGYKNCYIV